MDFTLPSTYSTDTTPPSHFAPNYLQLSAEETREYMRLTATEACGLPAEHIPLSEEVACSLLMLAEELSEDSPVYFVSPEAALQYDLRDFCPELAPNTVCIITLQEGGRVGRFEALGAVPGFAYNYSNIMGGVTTYLGKNYTADQIKVLGENLSTDSGKWLKTESSAGDIVSNRGEKASVNVRVVDSYVVFNDPFNPEGQLVIAVNVFKNILMQEGSITLENEDEYRSYLKSLENMQKWNEFADTMTIPFYIVVSGIAIWGVQRFTQVSKRKRQEDIEDRRGTGYRTGDFGRYVTERVLEIIDSAGFKNVKVSKKIIDEAIAGITVDKAILGIQVGEVARPIAEKIIVKLNAQKEQKRRR